MPRHHIQPLLNHKYPIAHKAKGIYIYDENDKAYLDGSSGAITCSLGHSHPKVLEVIKRQADKLQYVYRSQFGSTEAESLAEKLYQISPQKNHPYIFFVNSGSEAIETALKTAIQYWQEMGMPDKKKFITRKKSYHGITMGALSITGHSLRRQRFETSIYKNYSFDADPETDEIELHLQQLKNILDSEPPNSFAGMVFEPLVGAAGTALDPQTGYYQAIKKFCEANELLLIADEVMTGLGRTGSWFGIEHWQTIPDIIAIGKSLGAGYAPISATMISEKVLSPIRSGSGLIMSGHTYSGHPLSCAIAKAVLDIIEEEQLIDNVNKMSDLLLQGLFQLKKSYPQIMTVRGKGLMTGIELYPKYSSIRDSWIKNCFENGLLIYPSVGGHDGTTENGILVTPPFIIDTSGIDELLHKLEISLKLANGNT